jgi:phosphatidylglycerol:prolipoprotein diacylglycerol transferase
LIVYGLFRFLVEFTREPDPQLGFIAFGWLTMGQLLSMLLLVLGIGIMFKDRVVATRRSGDPSLTNY